jgi:hypothetical protein
MRLQSTIVEDGNMANFERMLRGLNFGTRPDEETIREIINLEIPGQPTIVQSIYALPENEFKNQLIERLNIPPDVEPRGGKKRRSKLKSKKISSRSKKISSRRLRTRRLRKTRSRRRYRK